MALRPDRDYNAMDDISRHWNIEETSGKQPGGIASVLVAGSGASLGGVQGSGVGLAGLASRGITNSVYYQADPSGAVPVGMLLQEITVPSEPDRYFKNFHKNSAFPGEKVTLIRKGWLVTDQIQGAPNAGDPAYLAPSGKVTPVEPDNAAQGPLVGKFETSKDEAGFARVFIDL